MNRVKAKIILLDVQNVMEETCILRCTKTFSFRDESNAEFNDANVTGRLCTGVTEYYSREHFEPVHMYFCIKKRPKLGDVVLERVPDTVSQNADKTCTIHTRPVRIANQTHLDEYAHVNAVVVVASTDTHSNCLNISQDEVDEYIEAHNKHSAPKYVTLEEEFYAEGVEYSSVDGTVMTFIGRDDDDIIADKTYTYGEVESILTKYTEHLYGHKTRSKDKLQETAKQWLAENV
jgi:hypothetical protein